MLAINYLENLGNSGGMGFFFYATFYVLFNLICLVFVVAIILSNYLYLQKKVCLTTSALSRIAANESNTITQKWINLLCMTPPIDDEGNDDKKMKLSDSERCFFFSP